MKIVHGVVVFLGLVVPLTPVVMGLTTGGFTINRFPNILCLPDSDDARFYSTVLPVSILIAVGASLLAVVINETLQVRYGLQSCL